MGQCRRDLRRRSTTGLWGSSGGVSHPPGAQRHKTGELLEIRKLDPVLTLVKAARVAAHAQATKMETFSWHSLKLNYAVESSTNQTTVIFALLTPAIFTSVSLCVLTI